MVDVLLPDQQELTEWMVESWQRGDVLYDYTGEGYKDINCALRDVPYIPLPSSVREFTEVFDEFFIQAPRTDCLRVFRGVQQLGELTADKGVLQGYLSTTSSQRIAEDFAAEAPAGGFLLRMVLLEPIPVLHVPSLQPGTAAEEEIILPRDCRFHVTDRGVDRDCRGDMVTTVDVGLMLPERMRAHDDLSEGL